MRTHYNDKLFDPRWQKRRLEIMERDEWRCVACWATDKTLHVHHIEYGKNPWDVPDSDLQTLCEACHRALGDHPAGGIGWDPTEPGQDPGFHWRHCPLCGSRDLKDKGPYDKCRSCGHTILPPDI